MARKLDLTISIINQTLNGKDIIGQTDRDHRKDHLNDAAKAGHRNLKTYSVTEL